MNYYKSESEFIDSLDFLSPPVKRVVDSRELFGYSYNGEPHSAQLFRGIPNKFTSKERGVDYEQEKSQQRKARRIPKSGRESSTSLVLKKTSERKILKRYTVLSYTNLHSCLNKATSDRISNRVDSKSKPLIKVTVIPKTDQIKTAKSLRKRRNIPKRAQSTPSNHENSIKTNNLYLVIAGRRNKIYEIKTTGSATFSSDPVDNYIYSKDDISIDGLSNVKYLIQSLDMDKRQKQVTKEYNTDEIEKTDLASKDTCQCESKGIDTYEAKETKGNLESDKKQSNRSRVRIYGQLGVTDDDRYFLRYGATVNDKPVTDFAQLTQDFLPQVLPESVYSPYEDNPEVTKEASVQAEHGNGSYYRIQQPTVTGFEFRNNSQGTQVNFNVSTLSRNLYNNLRVDKDVQCTCSNIVERSTTEDRCEVSPLNESHSPLVIISVYPKQCPEEMIKYTSENYHDRVNTDSRAQDVQKLKGDKNTIKKIKSSSVDETKEKKIIPIKKYNKRSPSRSLSPVRNNISKKISPENEKKTIVFKTRATNDERYKARDTNDDRYKTQARNDKHKTQATNDERYKAQATSAERYKTQSTSAERYKAQTTNAEPYKGMKVIKNKNFAKEKIKHEAPAPLRVGNSSFKPVHKSNKPPLKRINPVRSQDKQTNTEHVKVKKDLIDNYTKQFNGQISQREKIPVKRDNSKITINIDGNQEYYKVLLDQSNLSTDLRVNRRVKKIESQKCSNRTMSPSLENLLLMFEKEQNVQQVSVPLCDKQCDASSMNDIRLSGMTIRDSLEIFHSREEKQMCDKGSKQNNIPSHITENLKNNSTFLAPIKHYTGDACSICDPVERDKQIRELLGVNRSRCFVPKSLQAPSSTNDEYPLHCFYRRACEKKQLAEINLVKYCPILGSISKLARRTDCHHNCCRNATCNVAQTYQDNDDYDDKNFVNISAQSNKKNVDGYNQKPLMAGNRENSALYQQLILNRNIQVFLQVEQFSKQKPIILSRKQYDKVKKTIQTALNNKQKEKRKKSEERVSDITVGQVRQRRNKDVYFQSNQQIQTEVLGFKSSFQKIYKRPRVVSKVRYLARASRSNLTKDRFAGNDKFNYVDFYQGFGDLCGSSQNYSQNATKGDIEARQRTHPATILYPRNYEYYRPSAEYCEVKPQRQYEHLTGSRRNMKYIKLNDHRENQKNGDNFMQSDTIQENNFNKCDKYHILNENCHLGTKAYRKQNDRYRKECTESPKRNEKNGFEIGDYQRSTNKRGKECLEHHISDEESIKQKLVQPRQIKDFCKRSKEYCTVITKYCVDCGKRYKPNKECCKSIKEQRKSDYINFRDTIRHMPHHESSKKHTEYINSVNKYYKQSGEYHTTGLLRVSASDDPTIAVCQRKRGLIDNESKERVIISHTRHKACGEYNIKSEVPQSISVQRPPAREYQAGLTRDIGVHHSFQNTEKYRKNTETRKVNKVVEVHPIKKWEHYVPTHESQDVVLEHTKSLEEHNKLLIEYDPSLEVHEKSLRGHQTYSAILDKNLKASVSRFEEEIYEKRNSVSEQENEEIYSAHSRRSPDYFKHSAKPEEYFGQSLEYCRLNVEHHIHTEEQKKSDRYNAEMEERLDHSGHFEHTENEEQIRTVTLFDSQSKQDNVETDHADRSTKKTVSSLEIHYTSVSYLKKFDSTNSAVAVHSDSSLCHVNSIQTIFRGHRKSPTPNLGTSMYSLYSEEGMNSNKSTKFIMAPQDVKANKRPFLRRLMSCLVMRSTKPSVLKLPSTPAQEMPSVNSSVDSYHISTSLGAVEVSSSIYDTSASFYSNHTILPINSKIKRGFFNSVRGFLTNRKS
ncbi:unnamed protein product [Arctia plantaginis]|uniref:Uncharacterized protein n=1 Tax=Arctia plantaginis TaxID=874455 RepID=A0A8S1ABG7_ARCPL|nr:unnamed protein product [Arctia plantaginis]